MPEIDSKKPEDNKYFQTKLENFQFRDVFINAPSSVEELSSNMTLMKVKMLTYLHKHDILHKEDEAEEAIARYYNISNFFSGNSERFWT